MSATTKQRLRFSSLAPPDQKLRSRSRSCTVRKEIMLKSLQILFTVTLLLTTLLELTQRSGVAEILNQILGFRLSLQQIPIELVDYGHGSVSKPSTGVFNSTLLSYAAIDLGEADEREKISNLLETAAFGGRFHRRVAGHDSETVSYSSSRRRSYSVPLQLFHPRFAPFWIAFRRALRSWIFNKRYDPRVMAELIDLVKVPMDRHYRSSGTLTSSENATPNRTRFGSCAVVGNSGILLEGSHGSLIDSHEMVIRLNNAQIAGFRDSVGSKTSLAFVNSHILHSCSRRPGCFCHPYGENVPIVMYICQAVHFMDYAFCNSSHRAPLIITDARFDNLCARIVKYYSLKNFIEKTGKGPEEWSTAHEGTMFHYSSGMQAVILALGICDRVSLFGFGKSPKAKHHYHSNQKAELKLHDYEAEYQLYNDLANGSPNIPFLDGSGIQLPPLQIYV